MAPVSPEAVLAIASPPTAASVLGLPTTSLPSIVAGFDLGFGTEGLMRTVTGPFGLVVTFIYSFLIAFALPGASEIVLPLADRLTFWPDWLAYTAVILVSGVGKTAGSVLAFHLGREASQSGPVLRYLERSRFDVVEWSQRTAVRVARRYGYVGLALALCVPGFPDTISIYAFSVLEEDYPRFALATFVGSVGRLVVVLALAAGVLAVV